MSAREFRVGLVGAGHISAFHLEALGRIRDAKVVAIADQDVARARAVAVKHRVASVCGDVDQMLAAVPLDVVHVLTPPASHADVALRAIQAGCHVFVEKPLATSVADCRAIADAAAAAGRSVCVGHSLLWDPFVRRGLEIVRSGGLGGVVSVDYYRSQPRPEWAGGPVPAYFQDGGFPFRDLGVHALYLLEAFLGGIREVHTCLPGAGNDDVNLHAAEWNVSAECARGIGRMHLSWNVRPQQNLLVVQGTAGVMRIDLFGMSVTVRQKLPVPEHVARALNSVLEGASGAAQSVANVARAATGRIRRYHGLQALVEQFYSALRGGSAAPVTIADASGIVDWTERIATVGDAEKRRAVAARTIVPQADVLVTGASGYLGGRLLDRLLESGQRVRVLLRRRPTDPVFTDPRVEVIFGDLGDAAAVDRAVAGVRTVFHAGAAMRGAAADFDRATVSGTEHVVASALRHRVERFVYVSSLSVLDVLAERASVPITEQTPLESHPEKRGAYSRVKTAAESIVRNAAAHSGLPAIILRPGEIISEDRALMTSGVAQRIGRTLVVLGDGRRQMPVVHVDDVVDALLEAARRAPVGSIAHLVDPTVVSQNDMVAAYLRRSPARLRVVRVPLAIVLALAFGIERLCTMLKRTAPVSVYRIRSSSASRSFDCRVARRALGWEPRRGVGFVLAKQPSLGDASRSAPSHCPRAAALQAEAAVPASAEGGAA